MRSEICSEMLPLRWCFHLMNIANEKVRRQLELWRNRTSDIELQHLKPLLVHVETIQYLLARALQLFTCCCNDRQICRLQQASGELETNATRGGRYEEPGF